MSRKVDCVPWEEEKQKTCLLKDLRTSQTIDFQTTDDNDNDNNNNKNKQNKTRREINKQNKKEINKQKQNKITKKKQKEIH